MELEPITRKEKIIAGKDLQPVTRMEFFLKAYGGGGGGGGGSADAVLYTAQTLTDEQKKQARENIDAAGEFVINATQGSDGDLTLDKTFAQIQAAIQEGKRPVLKEACDGGIASIPLAASAETALVFAATAPSGDYGNITFVLLTSSDAVMAGKSNFPIFNSDGSMPQMPMVAAPSADMEIATKKYVDDNKCILESTTQGSTKKFKITVDDSGAISATEVTA